MDVAEIFVGLRADMSSTRETHEKDLSAINDEVAENIHELAGSVEETAASIEEMIYSIKEVAKNVEDLSLAAEQTSTSMNQMEASISHVERNATATAKLSAVARRRISCCSEATGRSISPWNTRPPPLLTMSATGLRPCSRSMHRS